MHDLKKAVLVAAALAALSAFAQEPAAAEHAPRIVCSEPTYNFGEMENTRDVDHTFILRNEGDLSLEIKQVRPSCGCTVASLSQNTIPPGGQAEVTTRLSLRGRQGPQHKLITVYSNDPKTPSLALYLEGTALEQIRVQPSQLFFGRITTDSSVTSTVEITVQDTNLVKITKLEPNPACLKATAESSADGRIIRLLISTQPPIGRGTLRGNVHVETDHPKYPAMDIAVSAFVVGDITYAPEELPVLEQPGPQAARTVLIRSETGKSFKIASVEVPLPEIAYVTREADNGGYQVELNNIPSTRAVEGQAVRIKTDLPGAQDIVIPFRFIPATPTPQ